MRAKISWVACGFGMSRSGNNDMKTLSEMTSSASNQDTIHDWLALSDDAHVMCAKASTLPGVKQASLMSLAVIDQACTSAPYPALLRWSQTCGNRCVLRLSIPSHPWTSKPHRHDVTMLSKVRFLSKQFTCDLVGNASLYKLLCDFKLHYR